MTIQAGKFRVRNVARDDAADASRFFSRMGYAVLAVGAPVGVVVHPLALFVFFPIGVALILMAAALEAKPGFIDRILRAFQAPSFLALIAGLGLGDAVRALDALSRVGAAGGAEARTADRGDGSDGRRAAGKRARHRSLSFPDRRRPPDDRDGGEGIVARSFRRRRRRWPACGRGRARGPALPGARRPDGARTEWLRAPPADPIARLRLCRQLPAADRRSVRRLSRDVVFDFRPHAHDARTRLGRGGADTPVPADSGLRPDHRRLDLQHQSSPSCRRLTRRCRLRRTSSPTTS